MDIKNFMLQLQHEILANHGNVAARICASISGVIKKEQSRPTVLWQEYQMQKLKEICKVLDTLANILVTPKINQELANVFLYNVRKELNILFEDTTVYLLRHPEKTKTAGRYLTDKGVAQASAYAQVLINEIKLCPKNVNVFMYTSEVPRTQTFANIVAYKLKKLAELEGRSVGVSQRGFDPRLGFRFTKKESDFYDTKAKEKNIPPAGSWPQFLDWMQNAKSYLNECPDVHLPEIIAEELEDFITIKQREHSTTENTWSVVLGFSHSWILDTLRFKYGKDKMQALIPETGYLKTNLNEINVDGLWHKRAT